MCYEMGAETLISGVSGNNLSQFCANGKGLRGDFVGRNPHFWSFLAWFGRLFLAVAKWCCDG